MSGIGPACRETVGFHQSMLVARRKDLDDIADAITKIYENRHKLSAAG